MLDFATLTGAARVALGPDIPPFFTDDEALAAAIAGQRRARPIRSGGCRSGSPTTQDRRDRSPTSTMRAPGAASPARSPPPCSCAASSRRRSWAHFDIFAWNPDARAYGPAGGEIQAARALFELLSERYPKR